MARFRALDGWRGICALIVAVYHFAISDHFHSINLQAVAGLSVDFFFVLSGFVIAARYADILTGWRVVAEFIQRRFARLWPLHVSIILLLLVFRTLGVYSNLQLPKLMPVEFGWHFLASVFANLLLLQAFSGSGQFTFNGPGWSISTEFYTYLVFAGLCLATVRLPISYRLAATVVLAILSVIALARLSSAGMEEVSRWSIFRCLYCFFVGVVTWHFWQRELLRMGGNAAEFAILIAAAVFVWLAFIEVNVAYLAPMVFAALILIFAQERGFVSRLLVTAPMSALGRWSYSIYLVHVMIGALIYAVLVASKDILSLPGLSIGAKQDTYIVIDTALGDVITLFYLLVVVSVAAMTYAAIEVPGQRFFGPRRECSDDVAATKSNGPVRGL